MPGWGHAEPDRPQALLGGFRGAIRNRIDRREALTGISAGQGLTLEPPDGIEPSTYALRDQVDGAL
jgi:hypothetical protein